MRVRAGDEASDRSRREENNKVELRMVLSSQCVTLRVASFFVIVCCLSRSLIPPPHCITFIIIIMVRASRVSGVDSET